MAVEHGKSWDGARKPDQVLCFAVARQSIFTNAHKMLRSNHAPTGILRFLHHLLHILFWYSSGMEHV